VDEPLSERSLTLVGTDGKEALFFELEKIENLEEWK